MHDRKFFVLFAAISSLAASSTVLAQSGGTTVTLLDSGSAPREPLRYRFQEAYSADMAMDMNIQIAASMAGMQMPPMGVPTIRMIMALDTTEVADDGSARFDFELGSASLVPGDDSNAQIAQALGASLGQMPEISGWMRLDARGNTLGFGLDPAAGVDPSLSQVFDSANQSIQNMSAPFPEEAVGVGAEWQAVMNTQSNGLSLTQTANYTLQSRNGDQVVLGISLVQEAGSQTVAMAGLPPGIEANLESLESSGSGTMQLNLSELVPVSELAINMAMAMGIAMQGQTQQINMNIEMAMTMAPADQAP